MKVTRRAKVAAGPVPTAARPSAPGQAFPRTGVLALCFVATLALAILGPIMTGDDTQLSGQGNPVRQAGYLLLSALTLFAIRPARRPAAILSMPAPIVISLVICGISLLWALAPDVGIRRLFLTSMVAWILCTAIANLRFSQITLLLRLVLATALIVNYATVFLFPDVGTHIFNEHDDIALLGDWRGIMAHKNFAGAICAVTVLVFVFDADDVPPFLRWPIAGAAAVFLYFSQSKTSFGMLGAGLAVGFLFSYYKSRYRPLLILLLVFTALGGALWANIYRNLTMQMLNDRNAFTGRAYIWQTLGKYLDDHWSTGAGYGSFWNIGPSSPINHYAKDWLTTIASGHNGYLDLMVQLGVPAAVIIIAAMMAWPLLKLILDNSIEGQRPALLLALLLFCIGHNMTESSLMERDIITGVFLFITIALIWKITDRKRVRRTSSRSEFSIA